MATRTVVVLIILLASAYSIPTPEKLLADNKNYRLPTTVVPSHYILDLNFPEPAFTTSGNKFTGSAIIEFITKEKVSEIKLHAAHDFISITKLTLLNYDLKAEAYNIDSTTDILTILTEGIPIQIGSVSRLVIEYTGKISTADNYGIYKSSYTNAKNEPVYLLTTQFEPYRARRAFPCFDEPSFKAIYDVSITYPDKNNLGVLFNTEQEKSTKDEGTTKVVFKTTPKMSSYLIALTISDFTSTKGDNIEGDNISYAVWSRNELAADREYAKDVGPTILKKLNEYTLRNYGTDMSKIDQVAVPVFSPGAMENWGLVIYRENLLLWNKDDSPTSGKQDIATTIAHELAHQWFGNLITCNWWSVSFLNEGFATYFQYFIPHQIEPTWQLDKQFVTKVLHAVLESDSVVGSLALQSDASSPEEVGAKFGTISYSKGGSILRMVSHIMGEKQFQKGIQDYVQSAELQYGTAIPSQLWEILEKHVTENSALPKGISLSAVMENWIEKAGYPLLTVSLDGKTLKISQERFLNTGEDNTTKWYVPISYVESADTTKFQNTLPTNWLTPETPELSITLTNENSWVLLNPQQTGYYRVNYDSTLWTKIAAALQQENFGGIIDLNRAQIVDDLFTLAKSDKIEFSFVLKTIEFLKSDTSYFSWTPALKGFSYIWEKTEEGSNYRAKIQNHLLTLMEKFYKSVSLTDVKDDDQIYTATQISAMLWACQLGEETCIKEATTAFSAFKEKGTKPNKNLKSLIYCNALKNSENVTDYEFLWDLYTKTEDVNERSVLLNSLGCSNNDEKLKELLGETIKSAEESKIKSSDLILPFSAVARSGSIKGEDILLEFLGSNLKDILAKYPGVNDKITLMSVIAEGIKSTSHVEKLKAIEDSGDFPSELKETTDAALKTAQSKLEWLANHQEDLDKFYEDETTSTSEATPTTDDDGGSTTTEAPSTDNGGETSSTSEATPTTDDDGGSTTTGAPSTDNGDSGTSTIYINVTLLVGIHVLSFLKLFA